MQKRTQQKAKKENISTELIAPCGINCALCLGYQRKKNTCPGCRHLQAKDPVSRFRCIIRDCEKLAETSSGYCYECDSYPCKRMKSLQKRYDTKYNVNIFTNQQLIKDQGIHALVRSDNLKWKCHECSGLLCMHREYCLNCKQKINQKN
jgi:hypothetical protein